MSDCPCNVEWCYFCQKVLPKKKYEHNMDWPKKSGQCPLYLSQIHDHDSSWPTNSDACLRKLHRLVALRKLKLLDDSPYNLFTSTLDDLFRKFPASFPSGYSLQDIRQINEEAAAEVSCESDDEGSFDGREQRRMRRARRMQINVSADEV
jgi:hypothetical protein